MTETDDIGKSGMEIAIERFTEAITRNMERIQDLERENRNMTATICDLMRVLDL